MLFVRKRFVLVTFSKQLNLNLRGISGSVDPCDPGKPRKLYPHLKQKFASRPEACLQFGHAMVGSDIL